MFKNKPIFIIIDGHSNLYKYYYALPNIIDKFKNFSGVIYGFLKMLQKILLIYKPKKIVIVFDSPIKNFRKMLFKKYKKNRKRMPKNLIHQFKLLLIILKILKITIFIVPKVEADDVIGTIATKKQKKYKILIISNDKDFTQIVNKNILIITNIQKKPVGIKEIKKKFGVKPKKITDLFTLIGDKSDNIPGIKGIGFKTAIIILKKFNSIKKIYNNLNKVSKINFRNKKKILINLKKQQKKSFFLKNLIKIKKDVKINFKNIKNNKNNKLKKINKNILNILKYFNFKDKNKYNMQIL